MRSHGALAKDLPRTAGKVKVAGDPRIVGNYEGSSKATERAKAFVAKRKKNAA